MRPQAQVKMGYYPTPPDVVDRIRSLLTYLQDGQTSVLDPCCGEGLSLRQLVDGAVAMTYGIEFDSQRAELAGECLDHVLKCGYEDTRISNNAFSCLFLNPPYDWSATPIEERSDRTEHAFLRGTVRYVQPQGVLVYIVPQQRVTERAAKSLAYRFTDVDAYRFPDEEYETFRQVVIFGAKKPKAGVDEAHFERLRAVPWDSLEDLPYRDSPAYVLSAAGEAKLFRSTLIDEAQLERELMESRLWESLRGWRRRSSSSRRLHPMAFPAVRGLSAG